VLGRITGHPQVGGAHRLPEGIEVVEVPPDHCHRRLSARHRPRRVSRPTIVILPSPPGP
jgi:hypothetical protein